jgi:putative flippase GtrA
MRELVRKVVTFGIIGGGCALLFFVINYVCLRLLGIPFLIALALTYLICFPVGYLLQRNLTFRSNVQHKRSLPRYFLLHLGGLGLVYFGTLALEPYFLPRSFAVPFLATCLAGLASFVISMSWVFAPLRPRTSSATVKP